MKRALISICCLLVGFLAGIVIGTPRMPWKEASTSEPMNDELVVLAARLASENYKAGHIIFLFTKIEAHTFVSGTHPNIVIGDDLPAVGERFAKAYNDETIRLRNDRKSQPTPGGDSSTRAGAGLGTPQE
jgi:hypothetical protein